MDLYLPALPQLADALGSTAAAAQLTLSTRVGDHEADPRPGSAVGAARHPGGVTVARFRGDVRAGQVI